MCVSAWGWGLRSEAEEVAGVAVSDPSVVVTFPKNLGWESMEGIQQLVSAQSVSAIFVINAAGSHSSRKLQSLGFVYIVERKQRSFTDRGKKSHTG